MIDERIKNNFITSANNWVCDGYSASIRFIAGFNGQEFEIWEAAINLMPLPPEVDNSFIFKADTILLGQKEIILGKKEEFISLIENAIDGILSTDDGDLFLPKEREFSFYTETIQRELWYYHLHLCATGRRNRHSAYSELAEIDNILRLSNPPFDGLQDAIAWLGLSGLTHQDTNPQINIRISPPVDLIFDQCALSNNKFKITLQAHPEFDVGLISVAIRAVPGKGIESRQHIANNLTWGEINDGKRIGEGIVHLENADNVLVMLLVGDVTVRRQWFLDPGKARNNRLLSIQTFDKDLKMIRNAVLEVSESQRFENGIAALLFLLGFAPSVQLEKDSPDIIVQTPNGRILLIECTLRISDFSSKLGKLVDRKGSLQKELQKSGHQNPVASALVCRLPRDQIAAHQGELKSHNVILFSQENLVNAFDQLRYQNDPDNLLANAEAELHREAQIPIPIGE